ncbi:unnamed protein product [Mytilus edulis]|uniref:COR domain-containing protein n=1 Tax=Mytilus edulis TaxID=6550 RepID=A0A8S3QYX0_MYTED|nr:unnamed protein product [Mytilus edulis]
MDVPDECLSYELDHQPPGINNLPVMTFSSKDVMEDVNGRRMYTLKNLLPETKYAFKLRSIYKDAKSHYSDLKTKQTLKEALPEAIRKLSEEDKARYNKLLQSEISEKRYFVRVMIVGKETVGKTCLMRRLLKEKISDVTSTDGVDIVVRRCKINIEDGEWTIGKEINDDKVGRIKRAQNQKAEKKNFQHMQVQTKNINKSHSVDMSTDEKDTTTDAEVNMDKSDDKMESPLVIHKDLATVAKVNIDEKENTNKSSSSVMSKNLVSNTQIGIDKKEDTKKSESLLIPGNLVIGTKVGLQINEDTNESSLVMPEDLMSNVFSKSAENTLSNLYALCELWDFAGQKEFYATHQAFLTSSAVYLVVADMKDDISKQGLNQCFADFSHIGEYVDFWFESIHCHRTADLQTNNEHFDPPILLVFTGKDKYNNEAEFKKREKELHDQINNVFGYKSKFHHLHQKFYLSNTMDTDEVFANLRYAISESARKMKNWGNAFPLKWVLLEHLIEINKNQGNHFINFTDMTKLAKHREINILDKKELLLFLRFQHNVGNIMFFEDIRDLIILKPQWLADAFRCLVSDRLDTSSLHHCKDWTLFHQQGKISESLIIELFKSKDESQFSGQIKNLNKVMEKLDIIVKIKGSIYYIMPSMMPSSTFDEVSQLFGIFNENCKKTSWLCFKFDFLPPSLFNHISAWFIKKYNPTEINSGLALYRGICMLDIDESGCEKILVTMSTDIIALQVVSFSEQAEGLGNICSDIYSEVGQFIENMKERYNVKISFELNFKCSNGDYYENTFKYSTLKTIQECYCQQHRKAHRSEQIYLPWMKAEVENIPDHRATNRRKQENLNSNNSNAVNISETKEAMNERLDNYVIQQCSTTEPDGSSNAVNISETEEDIGDLPHNSVNQQCSTTEPDDNSTCSNAVNISETKEETDELSDISVNKQSSTTESDDNSNAVNLFETKEEIDVLPGYSVNQQSSATESDGVSNSNNIIKKEEEMGKPLDISTKQKCSTTEPEGLLNAETTIETKEEMSTPTDSSNNQDFSTTEPDGNVSMFIFNVHGLYYFETSS